MDLEDVLKLNSIGLSPKTVLGLRTGIVGNVNFSYNQEVIYPVEHVFALHDYKTNNQRFLRIQENNTPLFIVLAPNRKLLAVVERVPFTDDYNISIYDLTTFKKRRNLNTPFKAKYQILQVSFTQDAKTLVILTAPPDDWIYMISLDKANTIIEFRPTIPDYEGSSVCMSCFQDDSSLLIVAGMGVVSFLRKEDKELNIANTVKGDFYITSLAYLEADLILLGTHDNEIILIDNGELKARYRASELDILDVLTEGKTSDAHSYTMLGTLIDRRVLNLLYFSKGFAFVIFNNIFVFQKLTKSKFQRKTILTIPINMYDENLYQILNIAVDLKQEIIVATANHAQIYTGELFIPNAVRKQYIKLTPLGALIHIDEIIDISICPKKTIIMTASKDQTIRIWNYETNKMELVRKYQVDVSVVELAVNGIIAAVGFSDQLRIAQIFIDELNYVKTYNFPRVKCVKYSCLGHLLAVAYDNIITLCSTFHLDIIQHLKGHSGVVQCITFTKTDKYLITGGDDGAIYQWDIESGIRIVEIVEKGNIYVSLAITQNEPYKIYAATNHGSIRQFQGGLLSRELWMPNKNKPAMTDFCLSRSDKIMFAGNIAGELYNVSVPFTEAGGGQIEPYRFFLSSITKICFSFDCTLLMVVSKAGTLGIFAMDNIEDHIAPYDIDLLKGREILIPRHILKEKDEQIRNLELRIKQQADEFQYQVSQNDIFGGQQLAEVHKMYWTALEELKNLNSTIEELHTAKMNEISFELDGVKSQYQADLETMANQYSDRMYTEFLKFNKLNETLEHLRELHDIKVAKSASELQQTVEVLDRNFGGMLDYRSHLIRELMNEIFERKVEFTEYCRQVEEVNQNYMDKNKSIMEYKLQIERAEKMIWRGKAGCLWKKYKVLQKKIDYYVEEVEVLKEENLKSLKNIEKLLQTIEELQKDVSDREYAINSKEKRIVELLHKNQEMDKYKGVYQHKIAELKSEIEPKEFLIRDKTKQIHELEVSLENLNNRNLQLERHVNELKTKYANNSAELHKQIRKTRGVGSRIDNISRDIFKVASKINVPNELNGAVKELFNKYANRSEIKQGIESDALVNAEFIRQQTAMFNKANDLKQQIAKLSAENNEPELLHKNVKLIEEIEHLRNGNKKLRKEAQRLLTRNKKLNIINEEEEARIEEDDD